MSAEHRLMQVNIKCIGVEPLFCCSQLISTKNHIIGSKWGKSWQKMQNPITNIFNHLFNISCENLGTGSWIRWER